MDVGTGSGCIALSLAAERPDAEVHATDISAPALAVAVENARRLGLEGRVAFHHGDLLEPVARFAGRIDLVVSNPPYVDPADRPGLAPEVRDHEPPEALFPPGDTLSVYRRLAARSAVGLREGGGLAARGVALRRRGGERDPRRRGLRGALGAPRPRRPRRASSSPAAEAPPAPSVG